MTDDIQTRVSPQPSSEGPTPAPANPFLDELVTRWRRDEQPTAREYLDRYPELNQQPELAVALIYEEVCLRREKGEQIRYEEVVAQFPQWRDRLEVLWECHQLLEDEARTLGESPPESQFADYILLEELGRGSQGTVYLANQVSLANRPVVIKLSDGTGQEHLTLARLQHAYIVPLYAAHESRDSHRRLLCMPYFGGATLQQLLDELEPVPLWRRSGQDLLAALDRIQARAPVQLPARGPARQLLGQLSYVQAICWIGSCLAEALQHAHERDCIHLDLKPSNILLAADVQPMLLDFHIAQKPLHPDEPSPVSLGGTALYMSPEQKQAMTAIEFGQSIPQPVDGRSDIYSLGLVLYETLGGVLQRQAGRKVLDVDVSRLSVSPGLKDILRKCLARRPEQRYQRTGDLAEDLRRHLHDLPLRGVRNRSPRERWQKWRRRSPHALPLWLMAVAVLTAALTFGWAGWQHIHYQREQAEAALQEGRQLFAQGQHGQAVQTFQRGVQFAASWPADQQLLEELEAALHQAQRAQAVAQLHLLADRFRFLAGTEAVPAGDLESLKPSWQKVWAKRGWLLSDSDSALNTETAERLRADLLDLALIWADLWVRSARPWEKDTARKEALQILAEAEELLGNSQVLLFQRLVLEKGPDRADPVQVGSPAPKTAWEHYALGRWYLQAGLLPEAAELLHQAVEMQPQAFWPNFHQGICAYRLGQPDQALTAFQVCIALAPSKAEVWYNRGLAQAAQKQTEAAMQSYHKALELNPGFAPAALNRGLLFYEQKNYQAARTDLEHALKSGHPPAPVYYNLALVNLALDDRPAALNSLQHALQADSQYQPARQLLTQLQMEGKGP